MHQCADANRQKEQGLPREGIDILGDPLIRIVDRGIGIEFVISPGLEIPVQIVIGQPAPPKKAQFTSHKIVKPIGGNGYDQDVETLSDRGPEAIGVLCCQCRGEFAGLLDEQYFGLGLAQQQQNQQNQQAGGLPFFPRHPVRFCNGPVSGPHVPGGCAMTFPSGRSTAGDPRLRNDAHVHLPALAGLHTRHLKS
ncbi:hypothetical protein D3C72_1597320 [compost metagenome]